jgi:hypothetical protein
VVTAVRVSAFALAGFGETAFDRFALEGVGLTCRAVARNRACPGSAFALAGFGETAFARFALEGVGLACQPWLAKRAKAGGGGRTRTCEAMRRLIYSQLPLPLGTLPRPNSVSKSSARSGGGQNHRYGAEPGSCYGSAVGRVYG